MDVKQIIDDKYKIIKVLSKSSVGAVYLVENTKLGTLWVAKKIEKAAGQKYGLLAEPDIMKRLNHPALPKIFDIIDNNEYMFIIEEYIEGISLENKLKTLGKFSEDMVREYAKQISDILIYLHCMQPNPIIYRDMKPSNLILTNNGNIKLVDFGISRQYKAEAPNDTVYMGTRGYAAPEQYGKSQTDVRTDIYNLGMTLYHLVTGKSPYDPPFVIQSLKQLDKSISKNFEHIIEKCTKQNPCDRYQTVAELLYDLNNKSHKKFKLLLDIMKSKNVLMNFKKQTYNRSKNFNMIAVGGSGSRVGCTHIAIQIGYFLSKQQSKPRVAVIQQNDKEDFQSLKSFKKAKILNENSFRLNNIDFYYNTSFIEIKNLCTYDYCVADIGHLKKTVAGKALKIGYYDIINLADISILVCNCKPWQYNDIATTLFKSHPDSIFSSCKYEEHIDNYSLIKNWKILFNLPDKQFSNDVNDFLSKYWSTYNYVFSPELFSLSDAEDIVLNQLLRQILY